MIKTLFLLLKLAIVVIIILSLIFRERLGKNKFNLVTAACGILILVLPIAEYVS